MREGWEYRKLGEIATFQRGLTYSKGDEAVISTKRVLRSNNINLETSALDLTEIKYLKEDFDIPKDRMLKEGSIFICMSNGSKQHVGKVAYINDELDYAFGGFMGLIVPMKNKAVPKFIYYYCLSSEYRCLLSSVGNGIGITNLKFSDLSTFPIPFPPYTEQERIVSELDLLSSIIDKKKAQLKEYDQLAQSIFYDMFGDPIDNPKGWEVRCLDSICSKISNGYNAKLEDDTYKTEGIMYFRCQNVWRNRFDYTDLVYIDEETNKKMKSSSLKHNDFLITKIGRVNTENSSLGRISLYEGEDGKANLSGNLCFARLKDNIANHKFILYILISDRFRDYIRRTTVGGIDKRALSVKQIGLFPIILPPLSLQQSFAKKIEAIEHQKELIKQSITETETLFNSRMEYWFA